ncbi:sensor histidine kinase [Bailinhaonella thermotolerans]|uniref:histidine kinase n=1 Tax=Bailinhaonella thermotolerans TaxID=1070861 RepID=A0A3A4B0P1_9ACTN|nr:sensor histidine kinase [Bailinhaonella thermotolerans]
MPEFAVRLARPFAEALATGEADPAPSPSGWGSVQVPRSPRLLGRRLDVLTAFEAVVACLVFLVTFNSLAATQNGLTPYWERTGIGPPWSDLTFALVALAGSAPLVLRRRWPLGAWRVALAGIAMSGWVNKSLFQMYDVLVIGVYLLCLYTLAARCQRRITVAAWSASVIGTFVIHPISLPIAVLVLTPIALLGYNVRVRRSAQVRLAEQRRATEEARAAGAVLEERARIARELHDVVAHHMSVIAIQAEATPLSARDDPEKLKAGLAEIRTMSLEALTEMRRVLGVLRDGDGTGDTAPQPGLDRIAELVETARGAGLDVTARVSGPEREVPPGVGLSAYRIVQESLSNAMRHAPGSRVLVHVLHGRGHLRLRVENGPPAAEPAPPAPGTGHGLVGMRERAAMLGGSVTAGPRADGGFVVTATLPLQEGE